MDLVWGSSQVQPCISGMSWVTQGPLPVAKQELNNIISLNIWRSQVGFRMRPPQTMSHWSQHINTSPSWQQKLICLQWFCSKRIHTDRDCHNRMHPIQLTTQIERITEVGRETRSKILDHCWMNCEAKIISLSLRVYMYVLSETQATCCQTSKRICTLVHSP